MSLAELPTVTTPVLRPVYDNRYVANFARWFAANEKALTEYYVTLGQFTAPEGGDFFGFVACQHDLAKIRAYGGPDL